MKVTYRLAKNLLECCVRLQKPIGFERTFVNNPLQSDLNRYPQYVTLMRKVYFRSDIYVADKNIQAV